MKLRQYDRRALNQSIDPQLSDIPQTNILNDDLNELTRAYANQLPQQQAKSFQGTVKEFNRGDVLGSLIKPGLDQGILSELQTSAATEPESAQLYFATTNFNFEEMSRITHVLTILAAQYTIVVTNPPYMGSGKMTPSLSKFVKREYPDSKADLFAVFMELAQKLNVQNGYHALITQHQWMFLSSFEKLRVKLRKNVLINMAHLGTHAFEEIGGEVVQSTAFVMRNASIPSYVGTYERLVNAPSQTAKEDAYLEMVKDPSCKGLYRTNQTNFGKIPGSPIAYWASANLIHDFEVGKPLSEYVDPRQGLATTDNKKYLRQWFEISFPSIHFSAHSTEEALQSGAKWFPYNKGGAYRKWYGNYDYIVNYQNDGEEIKRDVLRKYPYLKTPDFVVKNTDYYFREAITWSKVTSGLFNVRYRTIGSIFDTGGNEAFSRQGADLNFFMGLLNSKIGGYALSFINPTINMLTEDIKKVPIIITNEPVRESAAILAKMNTKIGKDEWDSFEVSWDFKLHPLIHNIVEHTVLAIHRIQQCLSNMCATVKHQAQKLTTWWHKIQNVPKKCQTFGLGGH